MLGIAGLISPTGIGVAHAALGQVMLLFVLPLTAVTLVVLMVRAVRGRMPRGA